MKDKKTDTKKFLKNMHHFKLSAYNSNIQEIRKQIQKIFKKYASF